VVFRSPIFRKLLLSAFILISVTLLILDFYLTRYTAQREVEQIQQQLTAEARILAGELRATPHDQLGPWVREASERAKARVTIVDSKGIVLSDSEHSSETMENHASRPEIQAAYQGRVGTSIRHSATLDRDLCYVALPAGPSGGPGFVIRLAVPIETLKAEIAAVRWRIVGSSALALVLALIIAYLISEPLTRRIRRLQSFAQNLLTVGPSEGLQSDADDELGALAGALTQMAAQLRDLLEKLRLESARREAILSSMVDGVLAVDRQMRITFCNESFARVMGTTARQLEQALLLTAVRDAGLRDLLASVVDSGKPLKQRLQVLSAEGRSFEIQAAPLSASARSGAVAVLHDITDLERLERIRKDFVANVSHELRTPLAAIRGYAETLLEGALEDPANNRKFIEVIRAQAARLTSIASDLLVLSDLESGRPEAHEAENISVIGALESARLAVESEAGLRGVELVNGRMDDVYVLGHRIRLEQALVNLLDNAVKFNRARGSVRIDLARRDDEVRITIADTGIGIPFEDLSRIFERFYRVDKARSREVGGTGLGLSIVKHAVERMHGRITVESELGKGSVFIITFPGVDNAQIE
jgi:two-component system phosphate regulon sensor histidine kinase PhoR